ncbi:unnamed protein product [Taenia asiatica]|uniref:GPS domain-containing protein n=1 Tax=Taenia asiatica TaxID=60517 RepID=A0A0R3W261_TAEAS|nr:unnamed protein product [Taenia asiatica]
MNGSNKLQQGALKSLSTCSLPTPNQTQHPTAGQSTITAVTNGDDGTSLEASHFFEVLDDEDFVLACKNHQRSGINVAQSIDFLHAEARVPTEGRTFKVEVDGDICLPLTDVKMDEPYEVTICVDKYLTEKLAGALEHVSLVNYEPLLPLYSGLEATATIAGEITFTTMNRIQSKLVEVVHVLPQLLTGSLYEVLVPEGSMFQSNFSTVGFVRFCRVVTWNLSNYREACGERNIIVPNITDLQNHADVLIRTSRFADNIYPFFNQGQYHPQSSLALLAFYADGTALTLSDTQLRSVLHSQRFEINQAEGNFVFQLHPTDTTTHPQYLVVVRFAIPPNLQVLNNCGSFYWAMLPSFTQPAETCPTSGKSNRSTPSTSTLTS